MQSAVDVWELFKANFLKLWYEHSSKGDAYPEQLFGPSAQQGQHAQKVTALVVLTSVAVVTTSFYNTVMQITVCWGVPLQPCG